MSTRSPAWSRPWTTSPCHALSAGIGSAAACSSLNPAGLGARSASGTTA
jgi:hypothetical protein